MKGSYFDPEEELLRQEEHDAEVEEAYLGEEEREAEEEHEAKLEAEQRRFDEGFEQWQRQQEEAAEEG
jgi:hypothetical protein